MRERIDKIVNSRFGKGADKFYNSPFYSVAMAAVCILCHTLDIPVVGAAFLTLLLVPSLLFCKNSLVLAPFLMMCSFVMSEETMPQSGYYGAPHRIVLLCLMLVIILAALVFNLVWYGKWRKIFKRAYLTVSLAVVSAVLVVGGLFSPTYAISGVGIAISIGVVMFLVYSLIVNCGEYKGEKTLEYFAYATICVAAVIAAAIFVQFVRHDFDFSHAKTFMYFGYAGPNTSAAFVLISIPFTFYLVYKKKQGYLFLLCVAVELLCIVSTVSRASLVVAVPGTVIVSIALCFKKKNGRLPYLIAFGIAVAASIALVIVFRNIIFDKISNIFSGKGDSGRFSLWGWGFEGWKNKPIFGLGFNYIERFGGYKPAYNHSFHCTPLTYLYSCGLVGLGAYIYHRYKTVRLVFSAKLTSERVFAALGVVAMLANALLDVAMNSPQHLIYYALMLALIEHDVRYTENRSVISNSGDIGNK